MPEYTAYTQDDTYWTIRKHGNWYRVARLRSGLYDEVERYGWYRSAGAAATAVGVLSYRKGLEDGHDMMRSVLEERLHGLGLVIPRPDKGGKAKAPTDAPDEDL